MNTRIISKMFAPLIFLLAMVYTASAASVEVVSQFSGNPSTVNITRDGKSETGIDISISEVEIVPAIINGVTYQFARLPESEFLASGQLAEDGRPSIPMVSTLLAVPDEAGIQISVNHSGFDTIDDIDLAPVQPAMSDSASEDPPFAIDEQAYTRDAFYPGKLAEAADPAILRDVRIVQISVYPVQYNPVRRQLRIYRDLSVSVSYSGDNVVNAKTVRRPFLSDGFYPIYRALLPNFDQFYSTLEVKRGGYLIIAKDMFVDSLQALVEWKHKKGYSVHLAPTSEIDTDGDPSQYQIHDYIQSAYENWEIPPEYVMIVGDEDNIGYTGIPDFPYNYYTSDHPYSMVEGSDYLPDVFVGRLSVDYMSELRVLTAKILAYEQSPQMDEPACWQRGLSIGGNVYAVTPRLTTLWVRQLLLRNGFTQVDTSYRWQSGQSDPYLLGYFNEGPCVVSYRGWSGSSGWYCPSFSVNNLAQIDFNNRQGVMASVACGTGDFGSVYSDPCFGEKWIRMGSLVSGLKGGPAFLGSADHSGHTRWHNPIMVGYYWGMFNEGIYHFAAAAVRGKIQLYRTFPEYNGPGQTVELYFHTFNMLGDPELEIRTGVPEYLTVEHPQSIPLGMNYVEITVRGENNAPVEGAFVTLIKEAGESEEVFEVGKTDGNGYVSFVFQADSPGDMSITVSGRNLYPYLGNIVIEEADIAVGFDSLEIDDDNNGNSSGNGDGNANPGETLELAAGLKNHGIGQTAYNVVAVLEPSDDHMARVYDSARAFGNIPPGETAFSDEPFVVKIEPGTVDCDIIRLQVVADDEYGNTWESALEIPVVAPRFIVSNVSFPGGDGRLDPGETAEMVLTLTNFGAMDAEGVSGHVTTVDDYTSILSPNADFGDIPVGGSGDNSALPMIVSSDNSTFDGRTVNCILHTATANGMRSEVPFSIVVGQIETNDPVGPDNYGYYMYDDTDIDYQPAPTYDWIELAPNLGGDGERMEFDNNDDDSQMITLPFDLVYYGIPYRYIIVSIDGFIAPDTTRYDMDGNFWSTFFNWSIPDPGNARAQISPFWDDLSYIGSNFGVYTWYDSDNSRYVIEWYNMTHRNTDATERFEIIILDPLHYPSLTGDAGLIFQYHTIINNDEIENYATVGFESFDELTGLQYTFDNLYHPAAATLSTSRTINITTNTGRAGVRGHVDLSNNGQNQDAVVSTTTGQYRITPASGDYWIRDVPPGENRVDVEADGCFPASVEVGLVANRTIGNVDFELGRCPVPSNLLASEGLGNRVELTWHPVDHQDLQGYNLFRSRWENGDYSSLNTMPITESSYTDYALPDDEVYWYYVTAVFAADDWTAESDPSDKDSGSRQNPTGADDDGAPLPDHFFLAQNYPNPFNSSTTFSYGLPSDAQVTVVIYDILGRRVTTLVDERQKAGYHRVTWNADRRTSGVYFARLEAEDHSETIKMVLLK